MKRLVLLNGPPRCGKDTLGRELAKLMSVSLVKNTAPMDHAIQSMFCISELEWSVIREKEKDVPREQFNGLSLRQVLISFSEDWAKAKFGQGVFGRIGVSALSTSRLNVCTDSGFAVEATEYVKALGPKAVLLFHVHREGTSFDGDSRSFIDVPGLTPIRLDNNGTPETAAVTLFRHIRNWLA